jgi:hypothetical protein
VSDHAGDVGTSGIIAAKDSYRPRKRADVLELDMGDGVVLYDSDSRLIHHLNPSASVIWQLAEGDASVEQLASEIAEELSIDLSDAHRHVSGLVAELDALDLVEDGTREGTPDG